MELMTFVGLLVGWLSVLVGAILKGGKIPYYVSVPAFNDPASPVSTTPPAMPE